MAEPSELAKGVLAAAGIEINGPADTDIQVHDERVWARVLRDRQIGLGEAYMDGWWDSSNLDETIARLLLVDAAQHLKIRPQHVQSLVRAAFQNRQTVRRAAENASAHYGIGNDLYERMLDKRMIYSCAYWANALDLDTAQEAKLDLICRKLYLEPGMAVLDIGCGWGGFAKFAAERYGVSVVGVSPSAEQVEVARAVTVDLDVEIRLTDYRDVSGRFDRIVSVGMFEHVGSKNHRAFFKACDRLLRPEGLMMHHTIGSNHSRSTTDPWIDKYIFPGGDLPSLAQMARTAEPMFTVDDVHSFGHDYDLTLQCWRDNIEARWEELPHLDERFRRMWRYYLSISMAGFRTRHTQLWQVVFGRTMARRENYISVR